MESKTLEPQSDNKKKKKKRPWKVFAWRRASAGFAMAHWGLSNIGTLLVPKVRMSIQHAQTTRIPSRLSKNKL